MKSEARNNPFTLDRVTAEDVPVPLISCRGDELIVPNVTVVVGYIV